MESIKQDLISKKGKMRFCKLVMNELTSDLRNKTIELSDDDVSDGRVYSAINELNVTNVIEEIYKDNPFYKEYDLELIEPNKNSASNREWYDIAFKNADVFIPINIKISALSRFADNLNCKTGLAYALTGLPPEELSQLSRLDWAAYGQAVVPHITDEETGTDYYFLIVNKNNLTDIFWNSLKHIPELVPNGSNLPFQCRFERNREPDDATQAESNKRLINTFSESLLKAIAPKQNLLNILQSV